MKIKKIIMTLSALILSGSYVQSGQRRSLGKAQVRTRTTANINKAIRAGNYPEADTLVKQLAPQMTAQDLEEVRSTINQRVQRTRSIQEKKPLEIIKQTVDTLQQEKEATVETQTKQEKEFSDVDISKATDYVKDYFTRSGATGHGYYLTRIYQYLEFLDTFQYRLEGDTFENIGKEFLKGTIAANKQSIRQAYEELLNTNDERTIMTGEAALLPALRELVKKAKETRNKSQLLIIPSDVEIPAIDKFDSEIEYIKDRYPAQEIIETPSDILKERIDAYFKPTKADPQKPTHTFFTRRIKQLLDFLDIFHHRLSPGMKFADLGKDLPKWTTQLGLREGYEELLKRNNKQQIMDAEPFLSLTLRNIISEAQKTKNKNNEFIIPLEVNMPSFFEFDAKIDEIKKQYLPTGTSQPMTTKEPSTQTTSLIKAPKDEEEPSLRTGKQRRYTTQRITQYAEFIGLFKDIFSNPSWIGIAQRRDKAITAPLKESTVLERLRKVEEITDEKMLEEELQNLLEALQEVVNTAYNNGKIPVNMPSMHDFDTILKRYQEKEALAVRSQQAIDDIRSLLQEQEKNTAVSTAFKNNVTWIMAPKVWEDKSYLPSNTSKFDIDSKFFADKITIDQYAQWIENLETLLGIVRNAAGKPQQGELLIPVTTPKEKKESDDEISDLIERANKATVTLDKLLKKDTPSQIAGNKPSKEIEGAFNKNKGLLTQDGVWETQEIPNTQEYNNLALELRNQKVKPKDFESWIDKLEQLIFILETADPLAKEPDPQDRPATVRYLVHKYNQPEYDAFFEFPHNVHQLTNQWQRGQMPEMNTEEQIKTASNNLTIVKNYIEQMQVLTEAVKLGLMEIFKVYYKIPNFVLESLYNRTLRLNNINNFMTLTTSFLTFIKYPLSKKELADYAKKVIKVANTYTTLSPETQQYFAAATPIIEQVEKEYPTSPSSTAGATQGGQVVTGSLQPTSKPTTNLPTQTELVELATQDQRIEHNLEVLKSDAHKFLFKAPHNLQKQFKVKDLLTNKPNLKDDQTRQNVMDDINLARDTIKRLHNAHREIMALLVKLSHPDYTNYFQQASQNIQTTIKQDKLGITKLPLNKQQLDILWQKMNEYPLNLLDLEKYQSNLENIESEVQKWAAASHS